MRKYTKYFLNGEEVTKEKIVSRKNKKLDETVVVVEKHYEAPLTNTEKEAKKVRAENASNYFREQRQIREDMEKYHG